MAELQDQLPPGWQCKIDKITGKYYFVNHNTKITTWVDPRTSSGSQHIHGNTRNFQNVNVQHIPMQHGSPDLKRNYIYPSQHSPIPAFQMPGYQSPKHNTFQELRNVSKMSPLTVRSAKIQDSSFIAVTDTDEAVAKISAMFPTVSETHIRLLLKNCRYMKSIFPQAEETVILDILANNDNNIQQTSEALKEMGFQRKDTVKVAQQKLEAKKTEEEEAEKKAKELKSKQENIIKIKTTEEKASIRKALQEKYKDVAEHLINIALESVDYNEKRANQILEIMVQEDETQNQAQSTSQINKSEVIKADANIATLPISQSRQSIKSILKSEKLEKNSYSRIVEDVDNELFKSPNLLSTKGANAELIKGPNGKNLLDDYVKWQGPNRSYRKGPQNLAKGSNPSLLCNRSYQPCGSNADLRKGPQFGLAKGSIFSHLKSVVIGESRGQ